MPYDALVELDKCVVGLQQASKLEAEAQNAGDARLQLRKQLFASEAEREKQAEIIKG